MDLPQHPPTGEHFLMRPPTDAQTRGDNYPINRQHWEMLADTLERCGATVTRMEPSDTHNTIFVRDQGVALPKEDGLHYGLAQYRGACGLAQGHDIAAELIGLGIIKSADGLMGALEGGNVVLDPARKTVFVGINNSNHMGVEHARKTTGLHQQVPGHMRLSRDDADTPRKRRYNDATPFVRGIEHAHVEYGERHGQRVVPIFVGDDQSDDFYHLDGVLGILPDGHAVVCMAALTKVAQRQIIQAIGRDNIIEISRAEALQGATNFVTVGAQVITPFASPALKGRVEGLGYTVIDPPTVGLSPGDWMFCPRGAVRCATLKLTPDHGFPPPAEPARGRA